MTQQAQFGNILDIDNYTDFVSDAIDAIHDAGDTIGGILKGISPALAFIPGIGTALSVGIYAAGAISAKDRLSDAVIGTASAAMPPGLPRIAFDGASNITLDIADGKNAFTSAIEAMRKCAATSGPQAEAAFNAALNMARGGRVDSRLIAEAKASFANGGKTAEMAFDAGIAVADGKSADQVVLDVARNYIRDAGGPLAAAAFDTGVAMGYGQTLQEAGWAGLHTLVRGNNPVEMIINFVQQVGASKAAGIAFPIFLENGLVRDATQALKAKGSNLIPDFTSIQNKLAPHIDWFQKNLPALDIPSGELAQEWGIDEAIIRVAQSAVDRVTGQINQALIDKFQVTDIPGTKPRNDAYEIDGQRLAAGDFRIGLFRSHAMFGRSPGWLRGFDIGVAVAASGINAGAQASVRDSIPTADQYAGFNSGAGLFNEYNTASMVTKSLTQYLPQSIIPVSNSIGINTMAHINASLGRTQAEIAYDKENDLWAAKGDVKVNADMRLSTARNLRADPNYKRGFNIGVEASGYGQTVEDSWHRAVKDNIANNYGGETLAGFCVAQALMYGIAKQEIDGLVSKAVGNLSPLQSVATGQLIVNGLTGTGFTSNQKAGVVEVAQNNPAVGAGAAAQVVANTGFWHKVAEFFGLA